MTYARNFPIGIYSSNPWFDGVAIPGFLTLFPDNPFLYYNPAGGGSPINVATYTQVGILNSPGSYQSVTGSDFLDPIYSQSQFGPFGGGVPANRNYYQTNAFGLGDSIAVDPILNTLGLGMRVNCQVQYTQPSVGWSNLQTHLQIYMDPSPTNNTLKNSLKAPRLTKTQKAEMLKKVMKRLGRKPSR